MYVLGGRVGEWRGESAVGNEGWADGKGTTVGWISLFRMFLTLFIYFRCISSAPPLS